jgi:hypothetical protein
VSNLIPFEFDGAPVRVIEVDGGPWFVGKDVAERLGYADPTNAMKQHCRGVVKRHPIVDGLGRTQEARILAEPDVLRLIVSSHLPEAEKFERWIFEDVLPSIRKTGRYEGRARQPLGLRLVASEFRGGLSIAKLAGLQGNQAILSAAKATERMTGMNPLRLVDAKHLVAQVQVRQYTPTELGARYGESAQAFNKRMERADLQVKNIHGHWQATDAGAEYAVLLDTGKKHSDGTPVQQLKWLESVTDLLGPRAA